MSIGKSWITDNKNEVRQVDSRPACAANANDQGAKKRQHHFEGFWLNFVVHMTQSYARHGRQQRV